MTVLVTPDEMQAAERTVIAAGTPASVLMRRAAESIAAWVIRHVPQIDGSPREAVAFVGPGNNGGDALVTLALLHEAGWITRAVLFGREGSGTLPAADESLEAVARVPASDMGLPDIILDGVFGYRSRASLPPDVREAFAITRKMRRHHSTPLVAIDIPSGVDGRTGEADPQAFSADVTLCLGLPKLGLVQLPAAEFVGELELVSIGIPAPDLPIVRPRLITEDVARTLVRRRPAFAHKHDTGSAIVVGGASTYYGAPRLTAEAALRAGAGLVHAAVPQSLVPVLAAQVPEVVLAPLDDTDGRAGAASIITLLSTHRDNPPALVAGPGIGRDERATMLLDELFAHIGELPVAEQPPTIIDADALNWLSLTGTVPAGVADGRVILTPHAGELARLLKCKRRDVEASPLDSALAAAREYRQVVLLKRGYSIVAIPDGRAWYAPRATPELATAGTGDVLAGLLGGLLAQGYGVEDGAVMGAFIGTRAGRMVRYSRGTIGVVARDVIHFIPAAIASISEPRLTYSER